MPKEKETGEDRLQRIVAVAAQWWRERQDKRGLPEAEFLAAHAELMPELSYRIKLLRRLAKETGGEHFESGGDALTYPALPVAAGRAAQGQRQRDDFASQHAITFEPGCEIARRYAIKTCLGEGGLGVVFLAHDCVLDKPVALKFFRQSLFVEEQAHVKAEVALSQRVSHVNVCRVHDINIDHSPSFLSMEYIDGEDLGRTLQRVGRIAPDRALEIALDMCAGLNAAHGSGVVHRDLKPQNVMIDGAGIARLTDFGLGRLVSILDKRGLMAGTPMYMAPELVDGRSANVQSDLFSLGIVLYELFTGEFPFGLHEAQPTKWDSSRIIPPSDIAPNIEPHVERTILRCLEANPMDRPTSAAAVAQLLKAEGRPLRLTQNQSLTEANGRLLRRFAIVAVCGLITGWLAMPYFRLVEQASFAHDSLAEYNALAVQTLQSLGITPQFAPGKYRSGFAYDAPFVNDLVAPSQNISYWYRQSPSFLETQRFVFSRENRSVRVNYNVPAWDQAGMSGVRLSPGGELREVRSLPVAEASGELKPSLPLDELLRTLFSQAGLEFDDYERSEVDQRASQQPSMPFSALGEPRIYRAKSAQSASLVRVNVVGEQVAWFYVYPSTARGTARKAKQSRLSATLYLAFMLLAAAGCLLARRNNALGRSDRRGASRSAGFIFVVCMIGWLFTAHHVPLFEGEVHLAQFGFANAIFWAATQWLLYMSLEPYLRAENAAGLTTWNRVLSGQWRNPLVARDILAGCAVGATATPVLGMLHHWLRFSCGVPDRLEVPPIDLGTLGNPLFMIGICAEATVNAVYSSFALVLLPLALSKALGHCRLGSVGVWIVVTALFSAYYGNGIVSWPEKLAWTCYMSLWAATFLAVALRYGLLATAAMLFTFQMTIHTPSTFDWNRWYAATGAITVASLVMAVIVYATWVLLQKRLPN